MFKKCLIVAALSVSTVLAVPANAASQPASPAPASFAMCAACHSTSANGAHGMGPNLRGTVGAKAAAKSGFNYSAGMRRSKIVWSPAELDAFLAAPRTKVPGTSMSYAGLKDPAKRAEIVRYLTELR